MTPKEKEKELIAVKDVYLEDASEGIFLDGRYSVVWVLKSEYLEKKIKNE